jgi:hypothetical protein
MERIGWVLRTICELNKLQILGEYNIIKYDKLNLRDSLYTSFGSQMTEKYWKCKILCREIWRPVSD